MWDVIFCTLVVYIFYLLFGGVLFVLTENPDEIKTVDIKNDSFKNMKSLLSSNDFLLEEIDGAVEGVRGYFRQPWDFIDAFIFSFHLCTTIGYGNLVPRSGRLLSVAYGAVGVPINLLFLKILGSAFLQAHRDTHWKVGGRWLADAAFFSTWALLLFFLPAFAFLERGWSFLDALYFAFVTFSTIGLGDYYVEGGVAVQLLLVWWGVHGLAFFCMLTDVLARLLNRHCLFALKYEAGLLQPYRTSVDAERLDLHFRLTNYPGLKYSVDFWGDVGKSEKADVLHQSHLRNLAHLAEKLRGLLGAEAQRRGGDMEDAFPSKKKSDKYVTIRHNRN